VVPPPGLAPVAVIIIEQHSPPGLVISPVNLPAIIDFTETLVFDFPRWSLVWRLSQAPLVVIVVGSSRVQPAPPSV
jgi:hypothetical protein